MDQGNILGPSAGRTGEAGKTAPQPVWEANEVITRERGGGGGRVTQRGTEPETPQLHIEPWLLESAETTTNESPTEEHLRIEGRATEEAARDACNMEPKPRGWPKDLELSATGKQELTETRQVPGWTTEEPTLWARPDARITWGKWEVLQGRRASTKRKAPTFLERR